MDQQRLILAIGRIERALSRFEQAPQNVAVSHDDAELLIRHEKLKTVARTAIIEIDNLLAKAAV